VGRIRIPVPGTIGKSVLIDPAAASKTAALEARITALERLLSGSAGTAHKNLSGLQVGDDHPQYAQHASAETISGAWNFSTIMTIQGDTLREYIEDRVGALVVDSTSIDFTYSDASGTLTATTINANPSGLIGMSAVNGTAATPLRSDGRHAIDPAIAPTWTGVHTFGSDMRQVNASPVFVQRNSAAGVDEKTWYWFVSSTAFNFYSVSDDEGVFRAAMRFNRTGTALTSVLFGNTTNSPTFGFDGSHVQLLRDNQELQLGVSQDLRLYHDGTDSWLRNDTGLLKLSIGSNPVLQFNASRAWGVDGANYGTSGQVLTSNGSAAAPSWQTGSGSGSTYGVYAASDQSKTSDTTLADDATLVATLSANKKYRLEFDALWDTSATPDLKFDLNFTGTTTSVFWTLDNRSGPTASLPTIATSGTPQAFACTALNVVQTFNVTSNTTLWEKIVVFIEVGASGGTFSLRWAQNTSSGTAITRRRNSCLLVTGVA
jgi:hypothetical protein